MYRNGRPISKLENGQETRNAIPSAQARRTEQRQVHPSILNRPEWSWTHLGPAGLQSKFGLQYSVGVLCINLVFRFGSVTVPSIIVLCVLRNYHLILIFRFGSVTVPSMSIAISLLYYVSSKLSFLFFDSGLWQYQYQVHVCQL